jgi:predicted HTH domain antitoxin
MLTISLQVPENAHATDFEVRMIVAAKLFDAGRLSSGQAAEMVGLSKRTFLELLGQYGVSVFGYTFEELEEDLKNA